MIKRLFVILAILSCASIGFSYPSSTGTIPSGAVVRTVGLRPIVPPNYTVATLPTPAAGDVGALVTILKLHFLCITSSSSL